MVIGLLLACGSQEPVDPCAGGGELLLELGEGGEDDFVAWEDGDTVTATQAADGWRLSVWLRSTGLDTTDAVTAVYRVDLGEGGTEDFVQAPFPSCDGVAGYTSAILGFEESPAGDASLTATLTDVHGASVEGTVELQITE